MVIVVIIFFNCCKNLWFRPTFAGFYELIVASWKNWGFVIVASCNQICHNCCKLQVNGPKLLQVASKFLIVALQKITCCPLPGNGLLKNVALHSMIGLYVYEGLYLFIHKKLFQSSQSKDKNLWNCFCNYLKYWI